MKPRIYIDGREGTTGLQIYERLAAREDLRLLLIDEERRKDSAERAKLMDEADVVFLCLPDEAAREAVTLVSNPDTRIIDASTAHRTDPAWAYGFPELSAAHREAVRTSRRVANPGCHATGFISVVYPLVAAGVLPPDTPLACFSLTGYSGGGKKMIAQYRAADRPQALDSPALYGMLQNHKHLPEMQRVCGLAAPPVFTPIVDDYDMGMASNVPFHMSQLRGVSTLHEVWQRLAEHYAPCASAGVIRVVDDPTAPGSGMDGGCRLYANRRRGRDSLSLIVAGNDERFTVTALFDNLGKGASGAAVQNMNLMLGLPETAGLSL